MPSRDDFELILLPWEHRGAQFDTRPDIVVELDWDGNPRSFLLKAKKNTLFFREAAQGNEFLCALETPLFSRSLSEEEVRQWMRTNAVFVATFWQEEIKAGRYARYFMGEHPHREGTFLLFFKQDGHGWLREPWDEDGLAFKWESKLVWYSPLFEWIAESFPTSFSVFASNKQLAAQIEDREMPEEAIKEQPLEWICGSREELEQLTRWMAFTDTESEEWRDATQKTLIFSCESDEGRAMLRSVLEDSLYSEPSVRLRALTDMALDFNTPVGVQWEFCDGSSGNPPFRGSWEPEGPEIRFSIEKPSQHEQLEARLQLRDWLRGKVPDANLDEWLAPVKIV